MATKVWVVLEVAPGPCDPIADSPLFGVCVSKEVALDRLTLWIFDAYGPGLDVAWEGGEDHYVGIIAQPNGDERVIQVTALDLLEAM